MFPCIPFKTYIWKLTYWSWFKLLGTFSALYCRNNQITYMSIWVYEYMSIWVYEYMSIWVYEYMSIWVYEYMSIWVCEYVSMWVCEYVSMWVCEYVSMWVCEYVSMWVCEYKLTSLAITSISWREHLAVSCLQNSYVQIVEKITINLRFSVSFLQW